MERSYFGLGNGRSGSSRRGKKSNSDKPKQPQRGLGVAQLEKIRLNQMGCCYVPSFQEEGLRMEMSFSSWASSSASSYGLHSNVMMGISDIKKTDIRYGDSQSNVGTARWNLNSSNNIQTGHAAESAIARPFIRLPIEDSTQKRRKHDFHDLMASNSQNSDFSDTQELDLELRLSL